VPVTDTSSDLPLIVCATPPMEASWKWFAPIFPKIRWQFFPCNPRGALERIVKRPSLAAWRSSWEAVRTAKRGNARLIISHDGRVTARCSLVAKAQRVTIPHVAWGFNFTNLPEGSQRRLMASAFKTVDRFVAYSTMERQVYSEYFDIDPQRIDVVLWSVNDPDVSSPTNPLVPGDYICALGGNARDYRTLFAAMERLPEITLHAVLRPENVAGLSVPANVKLHSGIKVGDANNILAFSRFTVLPLAGTAVPCGHVTIVAAMFLKKAVIVTDSQGVVDYVQDGVNGLFVPAADVDAMASRIADLWANQERGKQLGAAGEAFARANCSEQRMIDHLKLVLSDFGLPV
jgi:glycosyltransferase involved in cell wall biosynthesis